MRFFPIFLSVVWVLKNQAADLPQIIREIGAAVTPMVSVYELIIVDNASMDDSLSVLRELTGVGGEPDVQVYALTKEVDADTASWVGLEHALGDFVVVIDPRLEDVRFVPEMLEHAISGVDVVFASNRERPAQSLTYTTAFLLFNALYRSFGGADLVRDAPQYRLVSRRVINFILQHPQPPITYRHLPATAGFSKANLSYSSPPKGASIKQLRTSIDRGMRLLVSTTRAPMRVITWLCLFGAGANLCYSAYVVGVALFKDDVAAGWVSLSLQQSGMFLLISLVLLVLGEYILHMASLSGEGPLYHVAQEFTSAKLSRREKLNVEDADVTTGTPPSQIRRATA